MVEAGLLFVQHYSSFGTSSNMKALFSLVIVLLFAVPVVAFAHSEGEAQLLGEYRIEFSLVPEQPTVGVQQSFLLGIENPDDFSSVGDVPVWFRITGSAGVLFTTDHVVSSETEFITASFLPLQHGEYTVDVKTSQAIDTEDMVSFSFTVTGEDEIVQTIDVKENSTMSIVTIILLVIAIGLFLFVTVRTRHIN